MDFFLNLFSGEYDVNNKETFDTCKVDMRNFNFNFSILSGEITQHLLAFANFMYD